MVLTRSPHRFSTMTSDVQKRDILIHSPLGDAIVILTWWRHQMETFSALLAICAGNSPVSGEFPTQRPVTRSFDIYFDPRPDKRLSKQSWGWWFGTLSHSLWRHRNDFMRNCIPVNATIPHWWLINIGSCNVLTATNRYLSQCWPRSRCRHMASLGPNERIISCEINFHFLSETTISSQNN